LLNNKYLIVSISILAVYLLPYYYDIENSKFLIHDNLDSNIVWFKNLAESGFLFSHFDGLIERTHCGLPRSFYPTDLNIIPILFWVFPAINAYCVLQILMHLIAFLGMYFLSKDYLFKNNLYEEQKSCYLALIFSLVPFWPSGALTITGQPLLLWSFINLIQNKNNFFSWLIIFLFPFFSSLILGNLFLVSTGFIAYLIYSLKKSNINWNIISAFFLITMLSVIIEHRVFELFFIDKVSLQRIYSQSNTINFNGLVGISFHQIMKGQYHFFCRIWPFMPIFICVNYFYLKVKSIKINILRIFILIIILSILTTAKDLDIAIFYFPFLKSFNPRFISVNNILWFIIFGLSIMKFHKNPKFIKVISYPILFLILINSFFNFFSNDFQDFDSIENSFYHTYVIKESRTHKTFNEFYKIDEFKKINNFFDNSMIICCVGILPEVAQFNSLKTFGGYYPFYPQEYCLKFNSIINNSDKNCSKRLYLNYKDLNNENIFSKLLESNVKIMICTKPIRNKQLIFIENINNIWIYKLIS
tara:strand:- start:208 stop:1797 length:1590 start_codon:yes stop_codon:yes gene_type:complete